MRPQTITRYQNAIIELNRKNVQIHKSDFSKVSRELFKTYVALHYFYKGGFLKEVSKDVYSIRTDVSPNEIIKFYAKHQSNVAKLSAEKQKAKQNLLKAQEQIQLLKLKPKSKNGTFHTSEIDHQKCNVMDFSDQEIFDEIKRRGYSGELHINVKL